MVILSVSVCNKNGKILLARQYVPMSRLRIEGLLAAFPKLVDADETSTSKQHTFIETQEVRYIYQPMDTLYLLLITNMQSNILEDLSTLRMIAKLVPEYCGGQDEETVTENAFNLLYALDEVVTPMGYKESVSYKQIEDFVKMDSAEEKLSEIIKKSKLESAQETMKKKAAEFDKKRADDRKKLGSPGMGAFASNRLDALKSWRGSSGTNSLDIANNVTHLSSDTYNQQMGNDEAGNVRIEEHGASRNKYNRNNDSDSDDGYGSKRRDKKKPKKGKNMNVMKLGSSKRSDPLLRDAAEMDKKLDSSKYKALLERKSAGASDDDYVDASDLPPIEIIISEKLFVTFDRDGGLKKFEVKGDMEVAVNDPSATQCVIQTNINPAKKLKFGKPTWRLHPRMNSSEWKKGILCLKDEQKKFRVGRSSRTSILKWRMTTQEDSHVPISIEFWPEAESDGTVTVNAQYTCNIALKNVIISLPVPSKQEPEITNCENGDTAFDRRDEELQWILNDLEGETEGSLEYVVDDVQLEDLYPICVHFEIENTYSQIAIENIHDTDNEQQFENSVKGTCVAEKFILEY
eukprot:158446_1